MLNRGPQLLVGDPGAQNLRDGLPASLPQDASVNVNSGPYRDVPVHPEDLEIRARGVRRIDWYRRPPSKTYLRTPSGIAPHAVSRVAFPRCGMSDAFPTEEAALAHAWDSALRAVNGSPPLPSRPPAMPAEFGTVSGWLQTLADRLELDAGRYALITASDAEGLHQVAQYVAGLERAAGVTP